MMRDRRRRLEEARSRHASAAAGGIARAVVLAASDLELVGHVFELGIHWPKLILSSDATLAYDGEGWWLETSGNRIATWVDGRELAGEERVWLIGGEILAIGGRADASGRVNGGSILLFDATPDMLESGMWGTAVTKG